MSPTSPSPSREQFAELCRRVETLQLNLETERATNQTNLETERAKLRAEIDRIETFYSNSKLFWKSVAESVDLFNDAKHRESANVDYSKKRARNLGYPVKKLFSPKRKIQAHEGRSPRIPTL